MSCVQWNDRKDCKIRLKTFTFVMVAQIHAYIYKYHKTVIQRVHGLNIQKRGKHNKPQTAHPKSVC